MKLLLFDIDGTLIRSQGAGRTTLKLTLQEMFGTAGPIDDYKMSGKTDHRIITDLLTAAGIPNEVIIAKLPSIYRLMAVKGRQIFPESDMEPCPGVPTLLAALVRMDNVLLGLLTGNVSLTSPIKLTAAGIEPHLFQIGAYGSDAADRNELPAIAMERASRHSGKTFNGQNTIIIGDTPADILCARAGKATAVAVASGWHSAKTLAGHQPDFLLENLADTPRVLDILVNGISGS
jgi:phosphoglycolate phosphatase-like HAD superfamily hydrolase